MMHPYKLFTHMKDCVVHESSSAEYPIGVDILHIGVAFTMSKWHWTVKEMDRNRCVGDRLADDALEEAEEVEVEGSRRDYMARVRKRASQGGVACREFLKSLEEPPPFPVDEEKLKVGQDAFMGRLPATSMVLLHLSLVGGFSSPNINKVLFATGYLTNPDPRAIRRRLFETMVMVAAVCTHPLPGRGSIEVGKVRLLHAAVRKRVSQSKSYDKTKFGVPVNQSDLVTTALSFSVNVIHGLGAMGCPMTKAEVEGYLELWKVVGYYMGIDPANDPHESYETAKARLESLILHCVSPLLAHA